MGLTKNIREVTDSDFPTDEGVLCDLSFIIIC